MFVIREVFSGGFETKTAITMPYITIEGGALTKEQKNELIRSVTEVASQITQVPEEFFLVTVKELPDENIGIGGKTIAVIKEEYKASH